MPKLPVAACRHRPTDAPEPKLRSVALVQLIAIVTLALSTLIAATAVSIGLARADVAPAPTGANATPLAIELSRTGSAA
jgi:hypothetical protein